MPPLMRDKCVHIRFSRGSEYCSCASSTASRASYVCARAGEDVENQLGAVEHLHTDRFFQIARLGREPRSLSKMTTSASAAAARRSQLLHFAAAKIGGYIGRLSLLGKRAHHAGAGRSGQAFQFFQRVFFG